MAIPTEACSSWQQWGQSSNHSGQVCVAGQMPAKILATINVDPFGGQETGSDGDLRVHYQVPLVVDDDVYVLQKSGSYTAPCPEPDAGAEAGCYSWNSQTWSESYYSWSGGKLAHNWTFTSDWKPAPSELASSEQLFQPAIAGAFLYLPGLGGSVHKLDRKSGEELGQLSPFGFGALDPDTYVSGPLVADAAGNIFYNVIKLDHFQPVYQDASAWLVKIEPGERVSSTPYSAIVTGAPTGISCHGTFYSAVPTPALPWPPPNDASGNPVVAPLIACGSQRPGLNVAPAIGKDGTVFTVSRAHFDSQDSFIVAVNGADLSPKWTTSLRGILNDGCGVTIPSDGDAMNAPYDCRPGTAKGVDIETNLPPAGRVIDESSSSPVALPDGGVLYGAFTVYNDYRGHVMKFDATGKSIGTYDFGWDYTPAVFSHDGTYSLVVKDNHYLFDQNGVPQGPYYVTQLDKDLNLEWHFQSTNTKSCKTINGVVSCVADHPHGFEWCINAPAVDDTGTVFAGGEDGVVYAIGQGGVLKGSLFIGMSLGASYTPLAIDHLGRLYSQNDGMMQVLGN